MDVLSYDSLVARVLEEMPKTHPFTAAHPHIAGPLAREIAYLEWRRHRVFDHSAIFPGVQMPDGEMGYSIHFYEGQEVTGPCVASRRTIALSRQEMQELRDQIDRELNS